VKKSSILIAVLALVMTLGLMGCASDGGNDATMEDVEGTGISNLAKIITTGSNYLGVIPEKCSEELCSVMESASIVLAKGQANYETLEGTSLAGDKTFFLLQAKCSVIAEHLGVEPGDSVLVRNI
jgi:uncharacterized protein with ATP-grasp and redox domains